MGIETITDAKTIVSNSGVVDWDWGGDSDSVLERLAEYLYRADEDELSDALLARFIREELGQNPADYFGQWILSRPALLACFVDAAFE